MFALFLYLSLLVPALSGQQIKSVTFGAMTTVNAANPGATSGDVFGNTICSDDQLYYFTDDTWGAGWIYHPTGRNLSLSSANDSLTTFAEINGMDSFGSVTQTISGRNAGWKAASLLCLDDVLYMTGSVTHIPSSGGLLQDSRASFLLKSADHGQTWLNHLNNASTKNWLTNATSSSTGIPRADGAAPPDVNSSYLPDRFAAPQFIQFGSFANGGCPSNVDACDTYLYATSVYGTPPIPEGQIYGDGLILGRILRSKLPDMIASDWQFYKGIGVSDGLDSSNWTSDVNEAVPVLTKLRRIAIFNPYYIPSVGRYIYITGAFTPAPGLCGSGFSAFSCPTRNTFWTVYEAPHPWGPWTEVRSQGWIPQGCYLPAAVGKLSGGNTVKLFTSCDFANQQNVTTGTYSTNYLDMTVSTDPPVLNRSRVSHLNNRHALDGHGLVAAYDFPGYYGTLPDRSTNGNTVDLLGMDGGNLAWSSSGMYFQKDAFSQISTPITTAFRDFTAQAVFLSSAVGNFDNVISKNYAAGFWMGRNGVLANTWGGGVIDADGSRRVFVTAADNAWHHLTLQRGGTTLSVSADGGSAATQTVSGSALDTAQLLIGSNGGSTKASNSTLGKFTGNIAHIAIYSRSVSSTVTERNRRYLKEWLSTKGVTLP